MTILSFLPPVERAPLALVLLDGLTYQQVAQRLALPEGTVKQRITAALRRLRRVQPLLG